MPCWARRTRLTVYVLLPSGEPHPIRWRRPWRACLGRARSLPSPRWYSVTGRRPPWWISALYRRPLVRYLRVPRRCSGPGRPISCPGGSTVPTRACGRSRYRGGDAGRCSTGCRCGNNKCNFRETLNGTGDLAKRRRPVIEMQRCDRGGRTRARRARSATSRCPTGSPCIFRGRRRRSCRWPLPCRARCGGMKLLSIFPDNRRPDNRCWMPPCSWWIPRPAFA